MGYTNWPKHKNGPHEKNCSKPKTIEYDCGCSWGCDQCSVRSFCPECRALFNDPPQIKPKEPIT